MTECTQSGFEFAALYRREVVARFDGGDMTTDAGGLLLRFPFAPSSSKAPKNISRLESIVYAKQLNDRERPHFILWSESQTYARTSSLRRHACFQTPSTSCRPAKT
jgi:hypothetical protein